MSVPRMKRVKIDVDEWYPVYSLIDDDWGDDAELTEKEIEIVREAYEDFKEAQTILKVGYCRVRGHDFREYHRYENGMPKEKYVMCSTCYTEQE